MSLNKRTRKSAYKVTIDLGKQGLKTRSAQLTNYDYNFQIGKQVVCACNF